MERLVHGDLGESLVHGASGRRDDPGGGARSPSSSPSPRCSSSCSGIPLGVYSALAPVLVLGHDADHAGARSSGASRCSCSATSPCTSSASSWTGYRSAASGPPSCGSSRPAGTASLPHPAGAHAGPHRGRLHLVHAARLHARGRRAPTSSAPRAPRGCSERKVIWGHGFKNAVIPVMTIAGIDLGALIGGAIITETVFNRPGIGLMIYQRHRPARCRGHRRRRAVRHLLLRVRQPARRPRLRLGRPARPSGGLTCRTGTSAKQEDRETYGSAWVTEADSVDARRTDEVVDEIVEEADQAARPVGRHLAAPQAQQARAGRPRHHHRLPVRRDGRDGLLSGALARPCQRGSEQAMRRRRRPERFAAGYLAPYDPNEVNYDLSPGGLGSPPSWSHPFGTDYLGRDVFSRTLVATRSRHARRHHRRRHRAHVGPAPGAGVRLLRRRDRLRHHARRRHLLRVPLHPVRAAHHERARAGVPERLHRHRRARLGDLRARRARPDPQRASPWSSSRPRAPRAPATCASSSATCCRTAWRRSTWPSPWPSAAPSPPRRR